MGGSQLSQLKAALRESGLSRQSNPKDKRKRKKQLSSQSLSHRSDKFQAINAQFNQFDTRDEKKKFAVVTRNGKVDGERKTKSEPGKSKSIGLENRKKTLLPLLDARNHTSVIVDHRFGEGRANLTPEEKMLERFKAERTRSSSKSNKFNLEDDDSGAALTHGGQKLGFGDEEDLEDGGGWGGGLPALTRAAENDDNDEDADQDRKRSRTEIMNEVVAKSKAYKQERQRMRAEDDELRAELDAGLDELRSALSGRPTQVVQESSATTNGNGSKSVEPSVEAPSSAESEGEDEDEASEESSLASDDSDDDEISDSDGNDDGESGTVELDDEAFGALLQAAGKSKVNRELLAKLIGQGEERKKSVKTADKAAPPAQSVSASDQPPREERPATPAAEEEKDDDPYDSYVRMLALEPRVQATNRLKTPLEKAKEAADQLRAEEEARLKRQRGEKVDDSDDDEADGPARKKKRKPEADDLEDDYVRDMIDGDEDPELLGLGAGLEDDAAAALDHSDDGSVDEDADSQAGGDDSDEDDAEEEEEDFGGIEVGDIEALSSDEEEDDGESDAESDAQQDLVPSIDAPAASSGSGELPYTFPCPSTHAELVKLLATNAIKEEDTATVVKRIRVLYHPGLAEANKAKLQTFTCVLLDHILFLAGRQSFETINSLLPSFLTLCHAFPLTTAPHFVDKLALMQKNLVRGLSQGPLDPRARTWPGPVELTLLRLVGVVWSTSDLSHPVAAPAMLLIAQYLSQARIRSLKDIASGLFLCALASQYEELSKRLVPESMAFLMHALLILVPTSFDKTSVPGDFAVPDVGQAHVKSLKLAKGEVGDLRKLDFKSCFSSEFEGQQAKADLAATTLDLVLDFCEKNVSLSAFVELASPAIEILTDSLAQKRPLPAPLKSKIEAVTSSVQRMVKLSKSTRKPLTLQKHRAIPIATYIPKFDEGFNPNKRFDPDSARAEASKLRALYKREKKATVRELRNDNKFLAKEEQARKAAKDKEYEKKISKIMSGLQDERAEEKAHYRAKEAGKKRDKDRRRR